LADKPHFPIRRFDVFAEYNRLKYLADGLPSDQAAGRGIWIAKVVAGRRAGPAASTKPAASARRGEKEEPEEEERFYSVGGVEQTDKTFEKEVVGRMGRDFYEEVFSPAIAKAFESGLRYEDIRDSIRKGWK
jgi:hypothetical protein